MITNEMLLTRSGPSSAIASSLILCSAATTRSSPVSCRRMLPNATGVPSASVPVIVESVSPIPGMLRAASICSCVTPSRLAAWSPALTSNEGAKNGAVGASIPATSGSPAIRAMRASIWASPPGVSASPRKRSVTTLTSPESPKSSSISAIALATSLSLGSVPSVSSGGSRRFDPMAIRTVRMRRTSSVSHGRTVTSQLSHPSMLCMATPNLQSFAAVHYRKAQRRAPPLASMTSPVM